MFCGIILPVGRIKVPAKSFVAAHFMPGVIVMQNGISEFQGDDVAEKSFCQRFRKGIFLRFVFKIKVHFIEVTQ